MFRLFAVGLLCWATVIASARTLRQASPWAAGVGLADRIPERPADWPLLTTQFSHVTPENCMKPAAVRPSEQAWHFEQADRFVAFAN